MTRHRTRASGTASRRNTPRARSTTPQAFERKLDMIRAHLTPASRLLELGCGTGTTAVALAPHAAHIDATELASAMLGIARDRAQAAAVTNITFREQTVEGLSPTDAPYDMVLALSLLHLLDDPRAALATIHGMLKPGGLFVSARVGRARFLSLAAADRPAAALDRPDPENPRLQPGDARGDDHRGRLCHRGRLSPDPPGRCLPDRPQDMKKPRTGRGFSCSGNPVSGPRRPPAASGSTG
jgi:Methylase involved in ubiquinone/menaquinone biosynthesis